MIFVNCSKEQVGDIVIHQLKSHWLLLNETTIRESIDVSLNNVENSFCDSASPRLVVDEQVVFNPYHSVTWMFFLYFLSHNLGERGFATEADMVYYLNKIMHANDWYHAINLPKHVMAEHPVGSVLGRALYGDYLFFYQGITVGGSRRNQKLFYPELGNNVVLYANSSVLGNSHIGNNVILSTNTTIVNQNVPDNCIVFGQSPNIVIKHKTEAEILEMQSCFWNFRR